MSDLGPIPAKDQTNFLLGRLEGQLGSLTLTVQQSAATQAAANTQHEAEHAEFRRDIASVTSDVAILKDNKKSMSASRAETLTRVGILAAVVVGVAGVIVTILFH